MATAQKKSTGGKRTASSAGKRTSAAGKSASAGRKKAVSQPRPIRREVGAVVCFLLAIFAAFGYFNVHAIFIDFFCGLAKGLIGYGFWLVPPMLLVSSVVSDVPPGAACAAAGVVRHAPPGADGRAAPPDAGQDSYQWDGALIKTLWTSGTGHVQRRRCSAALIAMGFTAVFSKIGAGVVFDPGAGP